VEQKNTLKTVMRMRSALTLSSLRIKRKNLKAKEWAKALRKRSQSAVEAISFPAVSTCFFMLRFVSVQAIMAAASLVS